MIDERLQDQAAIYVAGALPESERQIFEDQLRGNIQLRHYVAELQQVTDQFAEMLPPVAPSPSVKEAVLREIAPSPRGQSSWAPWAIAAALAIFGGLMTLERETLQNDISELQANVDLAQLELRILRSTEQGPKDACAMVAWDEKEQRGMIKVNNLPAVQGKDYQLWVIDPANKTPVAAGILRVRADGVAHIEFRPSRPVEKAANFAVSLEREGGAPKSAGPEGPIVMKCTGQ